MKKMSDCYKAQINKAFEYIKFPNRKKETISNTLKAKVHGSDTVTILLPFEGFECERIDDTHDKVTFIYDDYSFDGIITWVPTTRGFVFINIE